MASPSWRLRKSPSISTRSKAKVDEELFKPRMNALAQVNDLERIHEEINNAPIIPSRWRLVVEARAHAMNGNFKDAAADRLLPTWR